MSHNTGHADGLLTSAFLPGAPLRAPHSQSPYGQCCKPAAVESMISLFDLVCFTVCAGDDLRFCVFYEVVGRSGLIYVLGLANPLLP